MVVIRLLEILCEMTSDCKEFMALQDHAGLLSATVGKCGVTGVMRLLLLEIKILMHS